MISAAHLKVTKSEGAVLEGISEIIQSFNWYSGLERSILSKKNHVFFADVGQCFVFQWDFFQCKVLDRFAGFRRAWPMKIEVAPFSANTQLRFPPKPLPHYQPIPKISDSTKEGKFKFQSACKAWIPQRDPNFWTVVLRKFLWKLKVKPSAKNNVTFTLILIFLSPENSN